MTTQSHCFTVVVGLAVIALARAPGQQREVKTEEIDLKQIRAVIDQAADEMNRFRVSGGKAGAATDPARKSADHLWRYREQHVGTPAAALATRAAIHFLQVANQDEQVMSLAERLPSDDPAWDGVISDMRASARKKGASERLVRKANFLLREVKDNRVRASIQLHMGRSYLDLNQPAEAETAFRAQREAPNTNAAREAEGFLYEITNLAVGQSAPQFESRTIDGALIRSADLKGKVVLLNFWATW
jgi:hypothetical protein